MSSKTSEIGFKSARRELIILVSMLLFSFSLLGCERGANKVPSAPATDSGASSSPTSRTATAVILPPPNPAHGFSHSHIFVIVMENLGYSQALATPAISALAKRWAYESQYYAITHPSLPNYLSLIGGSTFSITSDCVDCFVSAPSLASEMSQKGISWSAYMESLPSDCYLSPYAPDDLYAGKHDPFIYFTDIRSSATLCQSIKPLHELTDLLDANSKALPSFIWITPNLCNDGHNCSPTLAGYWLTSMVDEIIKSPIWENSGALYVTWDEGNGGDVTGVGNNEEVTNAGGGGHVLTLVIEPNLAPGTVFRQPMNHYSLLQSVEANFGLPLLGNSADPGIHPLP